MRAGVGWASSARWRVGGVGGGDSLRDICHTPRAHLQTHTKIHPYTQTHRQTHPYSQSLRNLGEGVRGLGVAKVCAGTGAGGGGGGGSGPKPPSKSLASSSSSSSSPSTRIRLKGLAALERSTGMFDSYRSRSLSYRSRSLSYRSRSRI